MSAANGNGKKPALRCRAKGCRRLPNGNELGLCVNCALKHAADPTSIEWKGDRRGPRDERGLWVTKLEQTLVDGLGKDITVTELVCRALRAGAPMQHAASYAGISESTFHVWLKSGRSEEGTPLERQFAFEIDKALAEVVVSGIARIAGSDDWRAHAWILERRFPRDFGQITRTEVANAPGESFKTMHTLDLSSMTLEERVALLAELDRQAENTVDGEIVDLDEHRAIGP